MPLASWPGSLRQALMLGASERFPQNTIASGTDAAIDKIRRRFTGGVRQFSGDTILEGAQIQTFEDFFVDTLQDGSLPFSWTHPRTGAPITCRFRPESPPEFVYLTSSVVKVRIVLEILP